MRPRRRLPRPARDCGHLAMDSTQACNAPPHCMHAAESPACMCCAGHDGTACMCCAGHDGTGVTACRQQACAQERRQVACGDSACATAATAGVCIRWHGRMPAPAAPPAQRCHAPSTRAGRAAAASAQGGPTRGTCRRLRAGGARMHGRHACRRRSPLQQRRGMQQPDQSTSCNHRQSCWCASGPAPLLRVDAQLPCGCA
jgi:hypothetical protein